MSKTYVIQWKSSVNGRAGKGTKLFKFEEAARLAEELNSGYPGIHHEPVEVDVPPDAPPDPEPSEREPAEAATEAAPVQHSPDFAFSA
jgi:hypothetical protein